MSENVKDLIKGIKENFEKEEQMVDESGSKLYVDAEGNSTTKDTGNPRMVKAHITASKKDEVVVMKAMLNDRDYKVGIYGKDGQEGELCPSTEARDMIGSVIASTTKINKEEARALAEGHDFDKKESEKFVNVSKEYVNTYLQTGRKFPLGSREDTNTTLVMEHKEYEEKERNIPIGKDENGKQINDKRLIKTPAFDKVKAISKCPVWKKK